MPKVTGNRCMFTGYNPATQSRSNKRKTIRSFEETIRTMDIKDTSEGPKFVHKCNPGCKSSGVHACGFKDCPTRYTTEQKRNVSAHELAQHVAEEFWPRCSWPACEFRYCDPSRYFRHKCSKHGHIATSRKTRDPNTFAHGSKRGSRSTADRRTAREDSIVSDDGAFDWSTAWPSTARLSSPTYSDISDMPSFDNNNAYHVDASSYAFGNYLPATFAPSLSVGIEDHRPRSMPSTAPYSTAETPYFVPTWTTSSYVDWPINMTDLYSEPSFEVPDSPPSVDLSGNSSPNKPARPTPMRLEDYFSESPTPDASGLCLDEPTLEAVLAELAQLEQSHRLSSRND